MTFRTSKLLLIGAGGTAGLLLSAQVARSGPPDALSCGVALIIESEHAKSNKFTELVGQLGPVIEYYTSKGRELAAQDRTAENAFALSREYQADWRLRKNVAKSCVKAAYSDPVFQKALRGG